jgi:hypothetical protein
LGGYAPLVCGSVIYRFEGGLLQRLPQEPSGGYMDRREKQRKYEQHYREKNRERIRVFNKNYREKFRDIILKRKKKYYKNNKEEIKKYYQKNKDKILEKVKKWRKANPEKFKLQRTPEKVKDYSLQRRHGITLEQFNQMLISQDNRCAICNKLFKNEKDKCVDHNHLTGQIRQVLCFNCNIGIGKFGDSIDLVNNALVYLKKWTGFGGEPF